METGQRRTQKHAVAMDSLRKAAFKAAFPAVIVNHIDSLLLKILGSRKITVFITLLITTPTTELYEYFKIISVNDLI